jgi:predicted aspartyl protease
MFPIALVLLANASTATTLPFEIANNKPFVQVAINGSEPQWFVLDTGNNGNSIIARECADRLQLKRGAEERADVGAGSGADVRLAHGSQAVHLRALGETLSVAEPTVLTLGHVARTEGRRVDGLLGNDFLSRHVVEIDYARSTITVHDPASFVPPPAATVVALKLETGWPIVEGTITARGGNPVPCDLIIDTGVRGVVTLFRPFSEKHGLHETPGILRDFVIGGGAGGVSRGDVGRLDAITLGARTFEQPVAIFSRDTSGIFALDGPDGIVGGELLRRHRVTFDYPHARMILEPYPAKAAPFEYDMSGLFLAAEGPAFAKIRIMSVNPETPATEAGLRTDDEIVSIDGRRTPKMTLNDARLLLRAPGTRRLEVRRGGRLRQVRLETRRLI